MKCKACTVIPCFFFWLKKKAKNACEVRQGFIVKTVPWQWSSIYCTVPAQINEPVHNLPAICLINTINEQVNWINLSSKKKSLFNRGYVYCVSASPSTCRAGDPAVMFGAGAHLSVLVQKQHSQQAEQTEWESVCVCEWERERVPRSIRVHLLAVHPRGWVQMLNMFKACVPDLHSCSSRKVTGSF